MQSCVRPLTHRASGQASPTLPVLLGWKRRLALIERFRTTCCSPAKLRMAFTVLACSGASSPAWPRAGASVPLRCTCRSRTSLGWRVYASKDNKEGDRGVDWDGAWERFKSTAAKGAQSLFKSLCSFMSAVADLFATNQGSPRRRAERRPSLGAHAAQLACRRGTVCADSTSAAFSVLLARTCAWHRLSSCVRVRAAYVNRRTWYWTFGALRTHSR